MATGSFAVGTPDMDALEFFFRMVEMGNKGKAIVQFGIVGRFALLLVHREFGEHPIDGFPVGHLLSQFEIDHYETYLLARRVGILVPFVLESGLFGRFQ